MSFAKLDVGNAFCNAPRQLVLDKILSSCPAAANAWASWVQRTLASALYVPFMCEGMDVSLQIWEGSPKGTPCRPFSSDHTSALCCKILRRSFLACKHAHMWMTVLCTVRQMH